MFLQVRLPQRRQGRRQQVQELRRGGSVLDRPGHRGLARLLRQSAQAAERAGLPVVVAALRRRRSLDSGCCNVETYVRKLCQPGSMVNDTSLPQN